MNDPRELLPLNTKITTSQQLQLLLAENAPPLENLEVEGDAVNFELLAAVLKRHARTLKKLTLTGKNKKALGDSSEAFLLALESCSELTFLAIRDFGRHLAKTYPPLLHTINRLPKLNTLDISGCALAKWIFSLPTLGKNQTITELYLDHGLAEEQWKPFCDYLQKNRTLQKINFRESAISLSAIELLIQVITEPECTITEIIWTPKDFYFNEINYWIAHFNCYGLHDTPGSLNQFDTNYGHQLDAFRTTGKHPNLKSYQQAIVLLGELQKYLTDKRNHRPKMELILEIPDEEILNWHLISAHILLHAKVVQQFTIRLLNQERSTYLSDQSATRFFGALRQCTHLRSFKMESFQEVFGLCEKHIVELFKILQTFPIEILSFNRTYIGPAGIECLRPILRAGKITEIDLTLTAIVSVVSIRLLASGISACSSLKKVILGRSPLTLWWWEILHSAVQPHRNHPVLIFQFSSEEEMRVKMKVLCTGIQAYGKKGDERPRAIFEKFCQEIAGIKQQWEQFHGQPEAPAPAANSKTPFWSKERGKDEKAPGFEMENLHANPSTPLLAARARPPKTYGGTEDSSKPLTK